MPFTPRTGHRAAPPDDDAVGDGAEGRTAEATSKDGSTDGPAGHRPDADVRWLTSTELGAWQGLTSMSARLNARLNRQLQDEHGISLADYEVLGRLHDAQGRRLRVGELGAALQWEQSRLSHHLTRMQRRGLITRADHAADRRGASAVLTDVGAHAIEAAAPSHVRAVRALLLDGLDGEQVAALAATTAAVNARMDEQEAAG